MNRHVRHVMALAITAWWLAACAGLTAMPGAESVVEGKVRFVSTQLSPSGADTAEVAVAGTSIATRVGADGRFVLVGVPAGDVDLVFRGAWGESDVRLEAVAPGQTVRVAVALGAAGAALEAVSRSSNDLDLDVLPDRWQLSWSDAAGDDPVIAMITGDEDFLARLDHDCLQLVGDRADAEPLLPSEILVGTASVALRFFGADALALLEEPFPGSAHVIEVGFCYRADDSPELTALTAETLFLTATVTVADDVQVPDTPEFSAEFDPDAIPLEPEAGAIVRLMVQGPEDALGTVAGGWLQRADDGGVDTRDLEVAFDRIEDDDEPPFLRAEPSQQDLLWLLGDDVAAGTYALTLTLTFAGEDDNAATSDASAEVEIAVTLTVLDGGTDEPTGDDGLVAELQPAAWNTNWRHVGGGWVTVKISGPGYLEIDLDAIALSTSEGGDDEADVLLRERAQRQGNHVRAFFRQRDAIGLLEDPVPGETYELWVFIAEDAALPVIVTVTGPPN